MKLNKLSYRIIEAKDYFLPEFWIELLIDGEPIENLLKTENKAIPYDYFENDLPSYFAEYKNKEIYLLGVCSCGIDSCGQVGCVLNKKDGFVTFREIFIDGRELPKDFEFKFSRENYNSVIDEIIKQVSKFKKAKESK